MTLASIGLDCLCGLHSICGPLSGHLAIGASSEDAWQAWLQEAQQDYLRGLPMPPYPNVPPPQDLVGEIYAVVREFAVHRVGRPSPFSAPGRLAARPASLSPAFSMPQRHTQAAPIQPPHPIFFRRGI